MKYRSLSFLIAVTVAASFISFGAFTPNMVRAWKDFQVEPQAFDWPHQMLTNLHWVWTTPVGFILGTIVLYKDRFLGTRTKLLANLVILIIVLVIWALWLWGTLPHRMVQLTSL